MPGARQASSNSSFRQPESWLVVIGGLLMWLAPEAWFGVVLLTAGVALEIAGITLEHRNGRNPEDRHAVER